MVEVNSVKSPIVPGCKLSKEGGGVNIDSTSYKKMVRSLMYLTATRPNLMFTVCLTSRCMDLPTVMHLQAVKKVQRYLKGTMDVGIFYSRNGSEKLLGYTDSDYAGDVDDMKSTYGYVFMLGTCSISWSSKKQPVVTLSTTEAEFIAAASCVCQVVWLRRILERVGHKQEGSTVIMCDNS